MIKHDAEIFIDGEVYYYELEKKIFLSTKLIETKKTDSEKCKIIEYTNFEGEKKKLYVSESTKIFDIVANKFVDEPKKILIYCPIFQDKVWVSTDVEISFSYCKMKSVKVEAKCLFADGVFIQDDSVE